MIRVNYGEEVAAETAARIANLLKGEIHACVSGLPEDLILQIMKRPGDTVLNIVSGKTIEEASRSLPDNTDETIGEAAVLIKATSEYRFNVKEISCLIDYFDSYPMDPRITWRYCLNSTQEQPVEILILKNIKINITNETN